MTKLVPELFKSLKNYNLKTFSKDLSAGIIVAIIALPLSIALGIASGVTPEVGLITAVVGCFVVALLGGSKVQIAGPTGAFIVIVYGIIEKHGMVGLTISTIMAGIILIVLGLIKGGNIIKFIPYPITTGFTSGIAITILTTQIKDIFGLTIDKVPAGFINQIKAYSTSFTTCNFYALGISLIAIIIIFLWPKIPKIGKVVPSTLIAVIILTFVAWILKLPVETIGSRFGDLKIGVNIVSFKNVSFDMIQSLLPSALTIAILAGIESLLSAVVADGMTGYKHNSNMELIGQGSANIASALFCGIPVTGAIARTAANVKNGGKTPVSALISAIFLLLMVLILLPLAKMIPMAVLGAILFVVSYNMGEWEYFTQIKKAPKSDYFVFIVTFLLTIFFDLIIGISVGMIFALVLFMKRMSDITDFDYITKGHKPDSFDNIDIPDYVQIYNINGPFFFGAADKFSQMIKSINPDCKLVIINLIAVPAIDATGFKALQQLYSNCKNKNIQTIFCGIHNHPEKTINKYGFKKLVGEENFLKDLNTAIEYSKKINFDK